MGLTHGAIPKQAINGAVKHGMKRSKTGKKKKSPLEKLSG